MIEFPLKVAVIDDDRMFRFQLASFLEALSEIEVIEFQDPKKALEEITQKNIKIVITDINMPEMTGDVLLKEIKNRDKSVDVIISSSASSLKLAEKCFVDGATSFVNKPLNRTDVLEVVEQSIGKFKKWKALLDKRAQVNNN